MKKLVLINGTMGAGKTTVCEQLLPLLDAAVYLDGDWCWKMHPFVVNEENKAMVLKNIAFLLRSFLNNSGLNVILFSWVMQQESIVSDLLSLLDGCSYRLYRFKLVCDETALQKHLQKDIDAGIRTPDVVERSLARLPLYEAMAGDPVDTGALSPKEAAEYIKSQID